MPTTDDDVGRLHKDKKRRTSIYSDREPVYYHSYLQLDKVLGAQRLLSAEPMTEAASPTQDDSAQEDKASGCPHAAQLGERISAPAAPVCPHAARMAEETEVNRRGAHDEHLFIVIHQTYELWFKQILWEIGSVQRMFSTAKASESDVGVATNRLKRVSEILRILVDQFTVLETMSPSGFLEFRDYLFPASGFQSVQFRLLENKLGLKREQRTPYGQGSYCTLLEPAHSHSLPPFWVSQLVAQLGRLVPQRRACRRRGCG